MSYLMVTSTVPRRVGLPHEFVKSISPFGSLIDIDATLPFINPWSDDYFVGGVDLGKFFHRDT